MKHSYRRPRNRVGTPVNFTATLGLLLGSGFGTVSLPSAWLPTAHAADDQAALSGVYLNYGGTGNTGLMGASGFGIRFQSERIKKGLRFTIGSQLEFASGSQSSAVNKPTSLIGGQVFFGATVSPFETAYVKPFLSLLPSLGWVYWNDSVVANRNIGLTFGGDLGGGGRYPSLQRGQGLWGSSRDLLSLHAGLDWHLGICDVRRISAYVWLSLLSRRERKRLWITSRARRCSTWRKPQEPR
jgi:hypothetical protein